MKKNKEILGPIVLALIVLLSGCATAPSSNTAEELNRINIPVLVVYPPDVGDLMALEMESGECPALSKSQLDYGQLRDETRALSGVKVDVFR